MGTRLGGALRGCGLGLLAGGLWFLVEAVGDRAAGGGVAAVRGGGRRGIRLPALIALLPLLARLADSLIGLVVRRRGVRLGLEAAAAVIALAVLGKPLSTAPLENRVVTAVPPPKETP